MTGVVHSILYIHIPSWHMFLLMVFKVGFYLLFKECFFFFFHCFIFTVIIFHESTITVESLHVIYAWLFDLFYLRAVKTETISIGTISVYCNKSCTEYEGHVEEKMYCLELKDCVYNCCPSWHLARSKVVVLYFSGLEKRSDRNVWCRTDMIVGHVEQGPCQIYSLYFYLCLPHWIHQWYGTGN